MKDIKDNYKEKFENNFKPENRLDIVKKGLEFKPQLNGRSPKHSNKLKWIISSLSVLVATTIILVLSFTLTGNKGVDGTIPVYTGMNVLESSPVKSKGLNIERDLEFEGVEIDYYAKKNDIIRIAIHLRNPEEYEILSLRINGKKFQTFEFKEGSTSELIYVDLKCQDSAGIQEFYISEIKYIDGTNITEKEVRYESRQSIYVALAFNVPEILVKKEEILLNSYSLNFDVTDPDKLFNDKDLVANLYEKDKLVDSKVVSMNDKTVFFDNLKLNTNYTVTLVLHADLLDGKSFVDLKLFNSDFKTKSGLVNEKINVSTDSISIDFETINNSINVVSSKLYLNDKLVDSRNNSNLIYNNLYSNSNYSLEVTYTYVLNDQVLLDSVLFDNIQTKAKKPLGDNDLDGVIFNFNNTISVSVNELTGDFYKANIDNIKLYVNGKVVHETNELTFTYKSQEEVKECYIEIFASYSLNEPSGKIYHISNIIK